MSKYKTINKVHRQENIGDINWLHFGIAKTSCAIKTESLSLLDISSFRFSKSPIESMKDFDSPIAFMERSFWY
jgi:hypothetical protein